MTNADDQSFRPSSGTERGRAVRAKLQSAATELISEIGWNAVTTRGLADRAGVRSGLVHYHFDSLQDLLRKAALAQFKSVVDALLDEEANIRGGPAALLAITEDFAGSDAKSVLMIETYLSAARDPLLKDQLAQNVDRFRRALISALAHQGVPHPEAAALVILAALDGLTLQKGLDDELDIGDAVALLRTFTSAPQSGQHS
ncbi:TetR/AcrR family transcriptional regulator [Brevibacterium marinum]|uniref:AcrR family transcriptional regulator n=1 Tax=Brevibacterium marinum TaxID=418643 RepID=A0A846S6Q3_9MICO|nr:TetR family transcriptional regulator [Brevibacterium marinum]NJC58723.1 AcrR family transcriptional regulator [Brevibacterium marinum]